MDNAWIKSFHNNLVVNVELAEVPRLRCPAVSVCQCPLCGDVSVIKWWFDDVSIIKWDLMTYELSGSELMMYELSGGDLMTQAYLQ